MRIKTMFDDDHVMTLWFKNEWITLVHVNGRTTSESSGNLFEAGQKHLAFAQKVKDINDNRGHLTGDVFQSATISTVTEELRTVPEVNGELDIKGIDPVSNVGGEDTLSANTTPVIDQGSLEIKSC